MRFEFIKLLQYFLLAIVFFIPVENSLEITPGATITRYTLLALIAIFLLAAAILNRLPRLPLLLAGLLPFLLWSALSLLWSHAAMDTAFALLQYVFYFLLAYLIYAICSPRFAGMVMLSFVLGFAVTGVAAIFGLRDAQADTLTRASAFGRQNAVGVWAAYALATLLFVSIRARWSRLVNLLAVGGLAVLGALATFATASRGGAICLGVSLLSANFMPGQRWRNRIVGLGVVAGLAAAFIAGQLPNSFIPERNMSRIVHMAQQVAESGGSERVFIWGAGFELFLRNTLIGTGFGSFEAVIATEGHYPQAVSSHNTYLSALVETGVVGFLLFLLGFIVLPLAAAFRQSDPLVRWLCVLLLLLMSISKFTGDNLFDRVAWIMYGLMAVVATRAHAAPAPEVPGKLPAAAAALPASPSEA